MMNGFYIDTINRATDGEFCATTPTGPDFNTIFSILPFSSDDHILQGLSISPSTPPTNRIEVREHQGLLYRRIQKEDDTYKDPVRRPKDPDPADGTALPPEDSRKTSWAAKDPPADPGSCLVAFGLQRCLESCGVEPKECAVINPTKKPPHHRPHPRSSALTPSTKETRKPERRKFPRNPVIHHSKLMLSIIRPLEMGSSNKLCPCTFK
ncbi:hypothetical protein ROHU_005748 [Labeo rohita]|uniref:Uncharacterized protein n=1 Tax=Labeo rohita TaxID=84645 RepID=A0A498N1M1_LABRO|nr:hypothetical protein ROHU_005748 [Labeo rohita]